MSNFSVNIFLKRNSKFKSLLITKSIYSSMVSFTLKYGL